MNQNSKTVKSEPSPRPNDIQEDYLKEEHPGFLYEVTTDVQFLESPLDAGSRNDNVILH